MFDKSNSLLCHIPNFFYSLKYGSGAAAATAACGRSEEILRFASRSESVNKRKSQHIAFMITLDLHFSNVTVCVFMFNTSCNTFWKWIHLYVQCVYYTMYNFTFLCIHLPLILLFQNCINPVYCENRFIYRLLHIQPNECVIFLGSFRRRCKESNHFSP